MAVKNLHLEHLEDEIINNGIDGGRASINFLQSLRDMLKGNVSKSVNMTVKWDGAPALFVGKHPETNQFIIAKKSLFNKEPKYYTTEQEIKDDLSGDLQDKFVESFKYLSKLNYSGIIQGDLMFTQSDKKDKKIGNEDYVTFTPNTITYAALKGSKLGNEIDNAKLGIVFHTSYSGSTLQDMSAKFGVDTSSLGNSSDVWVDDASYKDVSGTGKMTAKEAVKLSTALSTVGKTFRKITKKNLQTFNDINKMLQTKAAGATYKTYANTKIRSGTFDPSYKDFLLHVEKYFDEKVIAKLRTEKHKQLKTEIKEQTLRELRGLKTTIEALTIFQRGLIESKKIIVDSLNRVKSIGTFQKTDTGFKAVNPEGYVAIDKEGKAVKLVDRMEFSLNNFTVAKDWDK